MLEGYEVLRKISEGASAEVYLARPVGGAEHVIAEVMRAELRREPALAACFTAEAEARCSRAHPNVARRVRSGITLDGRHWLVTEPVGESLSGRLAARGPLTPRALVPLALQVCDGLEFLHRGGGAHGNLKPATVYVLAREGGPEQVKLIDFGLALLRPGRRLARPRGTMLVEPEYLAPERVQGQRATPLSDLYAAGVLFYELLTGFPPFTGADSAVVRRRQLEEPPAPLPEACASLAPVIERCLSKDPAARFQSAAELREALRQSLRGEADSVDVDIDACEPGGTPGLAHPPALPQVVGSYALGPALGRGAMGHVFQARHLTLDRRVALKVLRPELARSRVEVDRFIQEAQAVNRIRHEHIVEIYDCIDQTLPGGERRVVLVMELLEGRSLGEALAQGPLPLRRALRVMRQVAQALDAVHRVGVVHRDVKPDNVFLVPRGGADFVKMLDFGVAKLRGQGLDMVDGVPVVVGTPSHMAPEQICGRLTDHRTDVYALGVVLYRLLSGRLPFGGPQDQMIRAIVLEAPPPLPAQTPSGEPIPDALRALVAACLEKDPVRRPQTMAEVGTVLEGLLAVEPAVPRAVKPRRRHLTGPRVAGGLAGLLVIAGTALAGRAPAPTPAPAGPPPEPEEATAGPPAPAPFSLCDSSEWNPQPAVPPAPAEAPSPHLHPPAPAPASTLGTGQANQRRSVAASAAREMKRDDVIDPFRR